MSQQNEYTKPENVHSKCRRQISMLLEEQRMDDIWADMIQDRVDVAYMTRKLTDQQYDELCGMLPQ